MEHKIYQGFLELFMRERVLVFGGKECGKTSLVQSLMQFQFLGQTISASINVPAQNNNRHHQQNRQRRGNNENSPGFDRQLNSNVKQQQISEQYFFISQYGNANVVMRIWDLSMEHLFVFLNPSYERPQLLLAVYDSSDLDELYQVRSPLESYLENLREDQRARLTIFLVATKIDNDKVEPLSYGTQCWLRTYGIRMFYVSSTLNKGIDTLRACMFHCIYQKHQRYNFWVHRDSIVQRFLSKFHFQEKNPTNGNEPPLDEHNEYYLIKYCRKLLPFNQYPANLTLANIKITLQNICQCLDHMAIAEHDDQCSRRETTTNETSLKKASTKKFAKIFNY